MEGVVLTGAKNSMMPLHRHNNSHEAIYVLEGSAHLQIGSEEFALEGGDYASVPPGTAHSFAFTSHRTRLLTWTFGGSGAAMYAALGEPSEAIIYSKRARVPDWAKALPGVDIQFLPNEFSAVTPGEKSSVAPTRIEPYVLRIGEGEHLMAGDMLSHFSPIHARAAEASWY
jgi:quercetin 2,3-dioxygenase